MPAASRFSSFEAIKLESRLTPKPFLVAMINILPAWMLPRLLASTAKSSVFEVIAVEFGVISLVVALYLPSPVLSVTSVFSPP